MRLADPVRKLMRRDGPIGGKILATPVVVQDGRYTLPLIDVTAIATTPQGSMRLALAEREGIRDVPDRPAAASTKCRRADRVVVQQVQVPRLAEIYRPRSKTMPIVIFMAVMFATVRPRLPAREHRPLGMPGGSRSRSRGKTQRSAAPRRRMSSFSLPDASSRTILPATVVIASIAVLTVLRHCRVLAAPRRRSQSCS